MNFSDITKDLQGQKMFQILQHSRQLEQQGKDIIHLEIGDPDFDSPRIAIDALKFHLDAGETHYAPSSGLQELKDAGIALTERSRGFRPTSDQILVTSGANIQIYLACACLINPGDEIIICDPCFVSYVSIIKSLRGVPVSIQLDKNNGFAINLEKLHSAISGKTKAIIINSPHNPTGTVVSEETWRNIYELCESKSLYLISDEVYGRMIYSDTAVKFFSPSSIDFCRERTVLLHSLSKTYSMTGWRIGTVTGPTALIKNMSLLFETINSCVPPFIQLAAADLLRHDGKASAGMMEKLETRRNLMYENFLPFSTINCEKPDGAFYMFANIEATKMSSESFCSLILEQCGVAACPGVFFGKGGEGSVRFCFAISEPLIAEAIERMAGVFN